MIPVKAYESVFERGCVFETPAGSVEVKTIQPAGETRCTLTVCADGPAAQSCFLSYGTEKSLGSRVPLCEGRASVPNLAARGQEYYLLLETEDGAPLTGVLHIRAIHRYPYGRAFLDSRKQFTQHFGQTPIIDYDLEYYSTSEPLEPVMRALGDTSPACYLDHIIATITHPSMSEMEKAKAVWLFTGTAVQHNAMLMNLRETVPAIDKFYNDPTCDLDDITTWLFELGHTRCGVINGFVSGALLKRIGVRNEVMYACGGHTAAKALIEGKWRLWDVDGFKGVIPLDTNGDIPAYDWVIQPENIYLLDTVPCWEDTPADEGWLTAHDGHRVTGYVDGCRDHSETGFGSSWFGAPKRYPPRPPEPLPVRRRCGERVLLEWIGSYDRDGDFRDYNVLITDRDGKLIHEEAVVTPYLELTLPREEGLRFTVEARDWHAKDTEYFGRIYYTKRKPVEIPAEDVFLHAPWELISAQERAGKTDLISGTGGFQCIEGRDNILGQTRFARTELFPVTVGKNEKHIYRMIDETNYLFSGCRIRSLFETALPHTLRNKDGWHLTAVLRITDYDFAGDGRFPLMWLGKQESNIGVGIGLNCRTGLVYAACNIMGDWRYSGGFDPKGIVRIDVFCEAGEKKLRFYADGELISILDYTMFREGSFDVDALYLSGNPDAETEYMVFDLLV